MEYSLSIETIMMIFFIIAIIFSIWKFYAFMPMKKLPDDDTDTHAKKELEALMLRVIVHSYDKDAKRMLHMLYQNMLHHEHFDKEHYWRFNPNRLNNLIQSYLLTHDDCSNIYDIYNKQCKLIETSDVLSK